MREPSRHMLEAFGLGVGSPSIECICGRSHYAPDSEFCEDDEDVEMRAHALKHPTRVVLHENDDAVSAKMINGATVVVDCPCEFMAKLEDILWNERDRVLRYYTARRNADHAALALLDSQLGASETVSPEQT